MTDDIVTRLRGQACPECGLPSTHNQFDEAADEIERLRAERIRWERIAHDLHRRVDVYGEVCICDDYEQDWCGIHAYDDEIKGLKERGKA
jgi:hypothetical protein